MLEKDLGNVGASSCTAKYEGGFALAHATLLPYSTPSIFLQHLSYSCIVFLDHVASYTIHLPITSYHPPTHILTTPSPFSLPSS
jgi:hypothetical protein